MFLAVIFSFKNVSCATKTAFLSGHHGNPLDLGQKRHLWNTPVLVNNTTRTTHWWNEAGESPPVSRHPFLFNSILVSREIRTIFLDGTKHLSAFDTTRCFRHRDWSSAPGHCFSTVRTATYGRNKISFAGMGLIIFWSSCPNQSSLVWLTSQGWGRSSWGGGRGESQPVGLASHPQVNQKDFHSQFKADHSAAKKKRLVLADWLATFAPFVDRVPCADTNILIAAPASFRSLMFMWMCCKLKFTGAAMRSEFPNMKIACGRSQNLLSTASWARSAISHSQSPWVRELLPGGESTTRFHETNHFGQNKTNWVRKQFSTMDLTRKQSRQWSLCVEQEGYWLQSARSPTGQSLSLTTVQLTSLVGHLEGGGGWATELLQNFIKIIFSLFQKNLRSFGSVNHLQGERG